MSLYVYSGCPGSGKSYHACRDLKFHKGPKITNMKLSSIRDVAVMELKDIEPKMLMAFGLEYFKKKPFKENSILLVIDEAQLLFNSRSWNDKNRFSWLEFLSQHRHYGYKVVLVAQDISMIDKQFRCLCEYDCRHTAAGSISVVTRFFALVGVKMTCAKYYYYDTDVLISRDFYSISKRVYQHYDTRQDLLNNDFADVDVAPITKRLDATAGGDAERPAEGRPGLLSRLESRNKALRVVKTSSLPENASEGLESAAASAAEGPQAPILT